MSDMAHSLTWGRDEAELVTELQAGSDAAFEWLVTYYHASVYNLVYGILSDAADAADVTQEVFLRAFRGIRGFRRGSSLKTWLYRISVREALNHRRWCWRHHRQQVSIDDDSNGTCCGDGTRGFGRHAVRPVGDARDSVSGPQGAVAGAGRVSQRRNFARS